MLCSLKMFFVLISVTKKSVDINETNTVAFRNKALAAKLNQYVSPLYLFNRFYKCE